MYTFVDFTSQIVGRKGVPCPTNKGVSYTNLVCWLGCDLKNRLLLLLSYCLFKFKYDITVIVFKLFLQTFAMQILCRLQVAMLVLLRRWIARILV
jgi:hypothetical protein